MESHPKRQRTTRLAGRNLKRKICTDTYIVPIFCQFTEVDDDEQIDLVVAIRRHVEVLNSSFSDSESAREVVEGAAAAISALAKIGTVVLNFFSIRRLYRTQLTLSN